MDAKLGWAAAAVLAAGAAALYLWWPSDPPPAAVAVSHTGNAPWDTPIGPGQLRSAPQGQANVDVNFEFDEVPEGMARVDERGHLIVDVQLHNAIDAYLLHTDVPSRQVAAQALSAYFRRKLPAGAVDEAEALSAHYLAYMDAHDGALQRLRFLAPGADGLSAQAADQFAAWHAQRRNLRQAMLGASVYAQWFAAEDGRCGGLIDAMRSQNREPDSFEQNDPNAAIREPRPNGAAREDVQMRDALECANELARSFASIETQERQWTRHLAKYRRAVGELVEHNAAKRALLIAALRQQIFSTDAERERAQALGPL
ncbi:MAG: hypothetical protein V4582_05920 [Pseudomonadota bacterium]